MASRSANSSNPGAPAAPHLTGLKGLSAAAIRSMLSAARELRAAGPGVHAHVAAGRQVALLFYENSTRTRMAFEAASARLGATALALSSESSSATKGESLSDTARVLESQAADVLVLRHPSPDAAAFLALRSRIPVVNAGNGGGEHPTQGLLDLLTLEDALGDLHGKRIVIVGDVAHSRVARSNLFGLRALGATVVLCGPGTQVSARWSELGAEVSRDLDAALEGAHAVMGLRLQSERLGSDMPGAAGTLRTRYGITRERLAAHPDLWVLHPGPVMRGAEIADEVVDGPRSLIFKQDENGLYVRMAVLAMLLGAREGGPGFGTEQADTRKSPKRPEPLRRPSISGTAKEPVQ